MTGRRFLQKFDWFLLIAVLLLLALGVLMIYSATLGESGTDRSNTYRQIIYIGVGLTLLFVIILFDYRIFRNYSRIFYIILLVTLIGVLLLGTEIRGTRSWFDLGIINLQPAEFAKFVMIIVLAKYFSRYSDDMYKFKHILFSGILTFIPVVLIMMEPEFGSALVIIFIWLGMLLFARIRWWHLGVVLGGLAGLLVLAWRFVLRDYQKERLEVFLNPAKDPLGQGYNVTQSKIAIGSGGVWGRGLGHGSQSQLNFLPEQHTDFIFAVLAEELGFIGCLFLFSLFGFLFYRLVRIGRLARDRFGMFLVIGTVVLILSQLFINIGMNLGIFPVAGIPLPFLSFGGSSTLTVLLCMGLVFSVGLRTEPKIKSVG
ncbi:rod shape-determining protein RodA [Patescibacteria group bacterium]